MLDLRLYKASINVSLIDINLIFTRIQGIPDIAEMVYLLQYQGFLGCKLDNFSEAV